MSPETILSNIKFYAEIVGSIILAILAIVLFVKIVIKKADKNNNNKIEKDELTNADIQFCNELLKDSIKTIAVGLATQGGLTGKNAYNLILEQIKKSKKIFEEIEQEKKELKK